MKQLCAFLLLLVGYSVGSSCMERQFCPDDQPVDIRSETARKLLLDTFSAFGAVTANAESPDDDKRNEATDELLATAITGRIPQFITITDDLKVVDVINIAVEQIKKDNYSYRHLGIRLAYLKFLIEKKKAYVNRPNELGIRPLWAAGVRGDLDMVEFLLEVEGIFVNPYNTELNTYLTDYLQAILDGIVQVPGFDDIYRSNLETILVLIRSRIPHLRERPYRPQITTHNPFSLFFLQS